MSSPVIVQDRRSDLALREVFKDVYARAEGFFDPACTWGGPPLTQWAYRVVRASHPQLEAPQVQALVVAMERVYRARHGHGARATVAPAVGAAVDEPT